MKLFLILTLIFWSVSALGVQKVGSIPIDAEVMIRDGKKEQIRLERNVQVVFENQHMRCDKALIDLKTKTIHAEGNIVIVSPKYKIEAERISMEYEKNTGVLYNAYIEMGQASFEGEVIYKTGPEEFEAQKGSYTACTTCPPAWHFAGSKIKATYGGYAQVTNAFLHVGPVPFFWSPYMIVPLNSKRQTGFLFPSFPYGARSKLSITQPFFWAMSESTDSTWSINHSQERGTKGLVNYRYVLTPTAAGSFDASYIDDKLFPGTLSDKIKENPSVDFGRNQYDLSPISRWSTRYNHFYEMPEGYTHRAQINLVSDLLYPADYQDEVPGYGDPAIENRVSITKNSKSQHLSAEATVYTNLIKLNPLSDNRDAVHRFPSVRYSLVPQRVFDSPLLFQVDGRYDNFTRDSETYDVISTFSDTNGNGVKDSNESYCPATGACANQTEEIQIRAGQRYDLQPKLILPLQLGQYLDLVPSLTYRETGYQFPTTEAQTAQRRMVRTSVSARTRINGVFGDMSNEGTRYKHEIQPELTYTQIPWINDPSHTFFGQQEVGPAYTADLPISDTNPLHFDYEDRIYERNLLTFALNNRLIERSWDGAAAKYSQLVSFKILQSYDFYEANRVIKPMDDSRQPWSALQGILEARLGLFEAISQLQYYHYVGRTSSSTRVRLSDPRGNFGQVTYSQSFTMASGPRAIGFSNDFIFTVGTNFRYVGLEASATTSPYQQIWKDHEIKALVRPPGDCWSFEVTHKHFADPQIEDQYGFSFKMDYGAGL